MPVVEFDLTREYQQEILCIKEELDLKSHSGIIPGTSRYPASVSFDDCGIDINYKKGIEIIKKRFLYQDIFSVFETAKGIVIVFPKKHLLLIPIYKTPDENEKLISILYFLEKKCLVDRIQTIETTEALLKSHAKHKYNRSHSDAKTIIIFSVMALLSLIFVVFTVNTAIVERPIKKERAVEISGAYTSYDLDPYPWRSLIPDDMILKLDGMDELHVYGICGLQKAQQALDNLQKGETIHLLVNPDSGKVLDIKTSDEQLLDFDQSQLRITLLNCVMVLFSLLMLALSCIGVWTLFY